VSLETSTLSGWVGATAAALQPLVDAIASDILASDALHVDDTPVPVLAPGTGKTKTGRLWTYVRDERPFAGWRKPAALFFYSPDHKGEHPQAHLNDFRGVIHADGYAGFNELFAGGRMIEAGAQPSRRERVSCPQSGHIHVDEAARFSWRLNSRVEARSHLGKRGFKRHRHSNGWQNKRVTVL
jgi:hypothetical protein